MEEELTSKKLWILFRPYGSFYQNLFASLKSAHIIQLQERVRRARPEFRCINYKLFRNFHDGKEISFKTVQNAFILLNINIDTLC